MARLILSNLCLSFNILLLNTVLCKTLSTLISSRDLIKLVCSVSRIAKPFEPYFVCLLPEALKYCVWVGSGQPCFYFEGSEGSFQAVCFLLSVRHLFAWMWPLLLCLASDFCIFAQNEMNTDLGGGSWDPHIAAPLTHMEHLFPAEVWRCLEMVLPSLSSAWMRVIVILVLIPFIRK